MLSNPAEAKVTEVLWRQTPDLDVSPRHLVIRPGTRECIFVGVEAKRRGIYVVEADGSNRAKPLGVIEYQRQMQAQQLGGLSFSPDGRYLLFDANRPVREQSAPPCLARRPIGRGARRQADAARGRKGLRGCKKPDKSPTKISPGCGFVVNS